MSTRRRVDMGGEAGFVAEPVLQGEQVGAGPDGMGDAGQRRVGHEGLGEDQDEVERTLAVFGAHRGIGRCSVPERALEFEAAFVDRRNVRVVDVDQGHFAPRRGAAPRR